MVLLTYFQASDVLYISVLMREQLFNLKRTLLKASNGLHGYTTISFNDLGSRAKRERLTNEHQQAMITLQEMAVFNSLYGLKVA